MPGLKFETNLTQNTPAGNTYCQMNEKKKAFKASKHLHQIRSRNQGNLGVVLDLFDLGERYLCIFAEESKTQKRGENVEPPGKKRRILKTVLI